jgi:hypothetical protein
LYCGGIVVVVEHGELVSSGVGEWWCSVLVVRLRVGGVSMSWSIDNLLVTRDKAIARLCGALSTLSR